MDKSFQLAFQEMFISLSMRFSSLDLGDNAFSTPYPLSICKTIGKLSTEFFHSCTSIKRPRVPLWLLAATLEVPVISGRLMEVDHKLA